jgi:hypothetical protein
MSAPRKLALYGLLLVAVLAASLAAGAAASPTGLANAEPPAAEHGGVMAGGMIPGLAAAGDDHRLVPLTDTVPSSRRVTYGFRIVGNDGPVTQFDVQHTKRMHLIVVRRDFTGFQHLHPRISADGTWTTPLTIADPGVYRVFADFMVDGEKQTLATDLFVPGDFRPRALASPSAHVDAGDGYTVSLSGRPVAGEESILTFVVRHDGDVVRDLPLYLGARGHLVALRDGDLAYLHVHADEDRLAFDAEFPTPGAYRLFLQFRHGGQVRTAAFTVDVPEENR